MNPVEYLYRRLAPSRRIGADPLAGSGSRYVPIPVSTMKVIGLTRRRILQRRQALPFSCEDGRRLTLIIAYRNRAEHLARLLPPLRQCLEQQQVQARILVVEQAGQGLFNRGKLMNVGAHFSWDDSDYFCFHDVDMIPEQADYRCPSQPLRLVTRLSYTHRDFNDLCGPNLGGVVSMRRDQLQLINGFANSYWGWGQEDDDLLMRCLLAGLVPHQDSQGCYADLDTPLAEQQVNRQSCKRGSNLGQRRLMWRGLGQPDRDGLNSLHYELLARHDHEHYQHIVVDIGAPAPVENCA